ncbi:MAG: hypothetical protein WB677_25355 [Xanthobacteraceae bacterium]
MLARVSMIAAILLGPATVLAEDASTSFHDLLVEYRCPVVDRLEQIYEAADTASPQNLFLIIDFAARPQDYVQCVFDTRTRMLCEASSGFYYNKPTEPRSYRLPASAIAALGRLGFSTDDSAGNFQIWLDVTDPPDFNRIADFMLKALHDGYGARAGVTLEFNAPLAPRASSQCTPVS